MPKASRIVPGLGLAGLAGLALSIISACSETGAPVKMPPSVDLRRSWHASRVVGTPDKAAPYRVVPALGKLSFNRPTAVAQLPGEDWLFIAEIGGKVISVPRAPDAKPKPSTALDLRDAWASLKDKAPSLFDLTFHPKFTQNSQVFLCYVHPGDPQPRTRVSRFIVEKVNPPRIDPASEEVIYRWESGGHNGACLSFGNDGFLYISTGDGAGPNPPDGKNAGQDIGSPWGAVLRIDVDKPAAGRNYGIPADNPFRQRANALPEIWAYGFRNPWRMGFDSKTGALWLCDVGWETWEMVHRVERGGNHGWSRMEGRMLLRPEVQPGPTPIRPPVKDYTRADANSITGGIVYREGKNPSLEGAFIYGDYVTGKIWGLRAEDDEGYWHEELADTPLRIIDFEQGSDGEIFVLDHDYTQQLYRLEPAPQYHYEQKFPRQLSETGIFASTSDLKPADGVVPYSVTVEQWMDGAVARRLIALPGSSRVEIQRDKGETHWVFPEATVLVRTLLLERGEDEKPLRVETQILHRHLGEWRPYTYAWNDEQDDAELIDAGGENRTLKIAGHALRPTDDPAAVNERIWRHGGRGECVLCHNEPTGGVLGFNAAQLNRDIDVGGISYNQLEALEARGVIAGIDSDSRDKSLALVDPHDEKQNLNDRARSYMAANCGVCHNKTGDTTVTIFFPRDYTLEQTKALRPPNVGTFGVTDPWILRPGDPYGSIFLYRMAKLGYARMPHVGSRTVDSRGWTLLHDWVASLAKKEDAPRIANADSTARETLVAAKAPVTPATDAAIDQLLSTTRGSLAALYPLHGCQLDEKVAWRLVEKSQKLPSPDIRGIFETFLPDSMRRKTLGENPDPKTILAVKGDVARGKLIFHSDTSRCQQCHTIGSRVTRLGPDLKDIGKKYPPAELLTHILDPTAKVDPQFATWVAVMNNGVVRSGLKYVDKPEVVSIKTAKQEVFQMRRSDVQALRMEPGSMMPTLLLRDLTVQEAADLLAYLAGLKG